MIPPELEPKVGENIWQRWTQLIGYLRGYERRIYGKGIRVTQSGAGEAIEVIQPGLPVGRFHVSASDTTAAIGKGLLNLLVPRIEENGELVPLDGFLADGTYREPPVLTLDEKQVGEDNRSFVCLRIRVKPENQVLDPDDEEGLTVVHVPTLERGELGDLDPERDKNGVLLYPLAILYWVEPGLLGSVEQFVWFDLRHTFYPAKGSRPSKHVVRPS
ncbi:MAG: hypothetical protein AB7I98_03920 [Verrucomicrobiales bacterium]